MHYVSTLELASLVCISFFTGIVLHWFLIKYMRSTVSGFIKRLKRNMVVIEVAVREEAIARASGEDLKTVVRPYLHKAFERAAADLDKNLRNTIDDKYPQ